jgi:putative phosphoribosyl transferase
MVIKTPAETDIELAVGGEHLWATVCWPQEAKGVVMFAHGSGSSRFSPRNRRVAAGLRSAGLATVLLDLLTAREGERDQHTQQWRFDLPLLSERLIGALDWLLREEPGASVGLFGASTGAAAALMAAARRPLVVRAVVSRGGRPDLVLQMLPQVRCPTLLIVGQADPDVLILNQRALAAMTAPRDLAVVTGASHLFEEPGALEEVTSLAKEWFGHHLLPP